MNPLAEPQGGAAGPRAAAGAVGIPRPTRSDGFRAPMRGPAPEVEASLEPVRATFGDAEDRPSAPPATPGAPAALCTELLVLPDGRILVHNLTPVFADLLNGLNPADEAIKLRASQTDDPPTASPRCPG